MLLERLAGAQDLYHEMHKVAWFKTGKTGVWHSQVTLGPMVLGRFLCLYNSVAGVADPFSLPRTEVLSL